MSGGESTESSISPRLANDSLLSGSDSISVSHDDVELSPFGLAPSVAKQTFLGPLEFRADNSRRLEPLSVLLLSDRKPLQH